MLFNTLHFLLFLVVVVPVALLLRGRVARLFLVAASYYFYAAWNVAYLPLLLMTTLIDYTACYCLLRTESERRRRGLLLLSLCGNLGLLGYFKYGAFVWSDLLSPVAHWGGIEIDRGIAIVLPVGISFYTFQSMGHTIDVYRRRFMERVGPIDFALYVSFFPQLVAGPILRGAEFFPQVRNGWLRRRKEWYPAANLILVGFLKKVLIADNLALYVDAVYGDLGQYSWLEIGVATYAFAVQIYCDFSGYTDIARGVAKLLGIDIGLNFDYPYFSTSIVEFWRRWHISLSTWLRDYLYIPLGGSHGSPWDTRRNLLITMILGGFWHGANWQFLLWGLYHGVLLVVNHRFRERWESAPLRRTMRIAITFHLVLLGWFLFRVDSVGAIAAAVDSSGRGDLVRSPADLASACLALFAFCVAHAWRYKKRVELLREDKPLLLQAVVVLVSGTLLVLFGAPASNFIYFQF